MRKLRVALVLFGLAILAFVSWVFGIMMAVAQDLPSLETRQQYARAKNSVVVDNYGEKLATLTNNEGRIILSTEQIAPVMKEAVVAIEDARFYEHRGVDYRGIARALYQDILAGSAEQGASTITQQFVKQALSAQDSRTILQKFREAAIAYHLERQWSKDKILTEYLNEIYFGEGATGIEAAARTYFGNLPEHRGCGRGDDAPPCASELYPWEAALLAGMISSPSAYSPRNNPEAAKARRDLVLDRMTEQGYITPEEAELYKAKELPSPDDIKPPREQSQAPYFTSWLRQQLVDRYGAGTAFGGGLRVTSTLDLALQREIESIVASRVGGIEPTASVVVLDNDTAAVRAMVGGSNFDKVPFNLATNGHRQPGSAFKPFTLITALEQGRSISDVFTSAPVQIPFRTKVKKKNGKTKVANEVFDVNNYEDSYLGTVDLAAATTYSDNSVYSQLGTQIGPKNVAQTAYKLGIETDLASDRVRYSIDGGPFQPYNPALILGGLTTGVTPLEMAHAYSSIAADGQRVSGTMAAGDDGPLGIVAVETCTEDNLPIDQCPADEREPEADSTGASGINKTTRTRVIDADVARTTKEVLETVVTSGTGKNARTSEETWGKTGTTDDNGDAWFCGATEEITACVWVGHADSNTPMLTEFGGRPVDGGTIPALIFADVVNAYLRLQAAREEDEEVEPGETVTEESVGAASATETTAEPAPTDDSAPETDDSGSGGGQRGGGNAQAQESAAPDQAETPAPEPTGGGVVAE